MRAVTAIAGTTFAVTGPKPQGQLYRSVGGSWSGATDFGSRIDLSAVAVIGDSVWFASASSVIEWRGGVVEHVLPTTNDVRAIAGSARDDVWVATPYEIVHFDGSSWVNVPSSFIRAEAIVLVNGSPVLVGEKLHRRVDNKWVEENIGTSNITYVAAAEHGGEIYLVGTSSGLQPAPQVRRSMSGMWSALPAPPMQHACGIAVVGPDDLWVSGHTTTGSGTDEVTDGIVAHWDGTMWTSETRSGAGKLCALALHGGELWTSGTDAVLHRRAASGTWTTSAPIRAGSIEALASLGSTLWAAGDHGAILRRE